MVSISQLQEIPTRNMILLVGPPGAGKSTFCEQTILQSVVADKPIIYVTTVFGPSKVEMALKERGLRDVEPDSYLVKETKCIAMGDPYCEWEFR